jgi:hypothetical protein
MSATKLIMQPQRELWGKNCLHCNVKEMTLPTNDGSAEQASQHNQGNHVMDMGDGFYQVNYNNPQQTA